MHAHARALAVYATLKQVVDVSHDGLQTRGGNILRGILRILVQNVENDGQLIDIPVVNRRLRAVIVLINHGIACFPLQPIFLTARKEREAEQQKKACISSHGKNLY